MNGMPRAKADKTNSKKQSKNKSLFHRIFVHNIGYKLLAAGTALSCWLLTVWLG